MFFYYMYTIFRQCGRILPHWWTPHTQKRIIDRWSQPRKLHLYSIIIICNYITSPTEKWILRGIKIAL